MEGRGEGGKGEVGGGLGGGTSQVGLALSVVDISFPVCSVFAACEAKGCLHKLHLIRRSQNFSLRIGKNFCNLLLPPINSQYELTNERKFISIIVHLINNTCYNCCPY